MQYILMDYVGEAGCVVEVRPLVEGTLLTRDINDFINSCGD